MGLVLVLEPVFGVELGHASRANEALDEQVRLVKKSLRVMMMAWADESGRRGQIAERRVGVRLEALSPMPELTGRRVAAAR
jgi:hypothetical protein